jgi:hypothetical protein
MIIQQMKYDLKLLSSVCPVTLGIIKINDLPKPLSFPSQIFKTSPLLSQPSARFQFADVP